MARRVGAWLVWWVLLMSFWTGMDDSLATAELLVGAACAAMAASVAELVGHQSAVRFRMRIEWVAPALRLPFKVARDTLVVFGALWVRLVFGRKPSSGFVEVPVRVGTNTAEGVTRRVLLLGANSIAPNSFALGIDAEAEVMVVHKLVGVGR